MARTSLRASEAGLKQAQAVFKANGKSQDYLAGTVGCNQSLSDFSLWWEVNGQNWMKQLVKIESTHRNISHSWKFSEVQGKLLKHYYDANKLLVDCLNSDCYVSREVRESIKSTLILPIELIEKYKQN